MAFLDNSGDIILDAVLTDAGRKRLARGDGTFKVSKYAFGDDEIDYNSYNAGHLSGSAYFDLEILQTPVLEAFTNNRSSLKYRLTSLTNNNLLYLPILKINEVGTTAAPTTAITPTSLLSTDSFLVSTDKDTYDTITALDGTLALKGKYIIGHQTLQLATPHIMIDQGLDTIELDASQNMSAELTERQYMIEVDNRLVTIYDVANPDTTTGSPSFIDDDQIATYFVSQGVGSWVEGLTPGDLTGTDNTADPANGGNVISGPRGTRLQLSLQSSEFLRGSIYLFDTIGGGTITVGSDSFKYIDTTIKISGVSTGYALDIPIRLVKWVST